MPPKYIKTIQDELFYEYAKLISRSDFSGNLQQAFLSNKYQQLKDGSITISGTIKEWQKEPELPQECVFCGSTNQLQTDYMIPISRGGADSADNHILACKQCINSRNDRSLFQWLGLVDKDKLHKLVAGRYLKMLYDLHNQKGTLKTSIEYIGTLCTHCKNPAVCEIWDTVGDMTCFCLESIF